MQIDKDEQSRPGALLVSVSPADQPGPDGKFFTVFTPIEEILKLRHVDRVLAGHPWLDVPSDEIIGIKINRSQHKYVMRHVEAGRFIAIRAVARRGKLSRGCQLDEKGQPVVDYRFSWQRREKYVTDPVDVAWLEAFSQESARYADQVFLVEAIAGYFRRLRLSPNRPGRRRSG